MVKNNFKAVILSIVIELVFGFKVISNDGYLKAN